MRIRALLLALLTVGAISRVVFAGDDQFVIGYLEVRNDERYRSTRTHARYLTEALGRPFSGAEVALDEIRFHGSAANVTFSLERVRASSASALMDQVEMLHAEGVRFFVVDLASEPLAELASATRALELLLFNVSAREDDLRGTPCHPHLLHTIPSHAMLMDALGQYLVARKWREILVLEGPTSSDEALTEAFARTARRYGLKLVDRRPWVLGNDPRDRAKNNVALLTGGAHDVIFVADSEGEFARGVPYQTLSPRPVVGSEGLAPMAWHWAWDRHGAPQLERRFENKAKRPMSDFDWAAWMAVKAIGNAVQGSGSAEFGRLRDYLLDYDLILDGFKGYRLNFRSWNRQLRQPILLGTHNWVVERAPIQGFLHATNNLDTLGVDERESECKR